MTTSNVNLVPKTCSRCASEFVPNSNRQKFCTVCGRRPHAICERCGVEFKVHPTSLGRWCGAECSYAARRNPARADRDCETCGTRFTPNRAVSQFCSHKCWLVTVRRPDRVCEQCGAAYNTRHFARTCSRACAASLRATLGPQPCRRCGVMIDFKHGRNMKFCSKECRRLPLGTLRTTSEGYLSVRVEGGWQPAHRAVMEETLGRKLESHERVHHRNGVRTDNRPENLELWKVKGRSKKDPAGVRAADYHCAGCRCGK